MKYCSVTWQKKIEAYSDKLLSEEDELYVENHVRTCELCAESLAEKQQLISVFKTLPKISISPDFDIKVISKIDRIQLEMQNPIFRFFELFAVVFIVLFGVITFLGFQLFQEVNQQEIDQIKPKVQIESNLLLPEK